MKIKPELNRVIEFKYITLLISTAFCIVASIAVTIKFMIPETNYRWVFNIALDISGMIIAYVMLFSFVREIKRSLQNRALIRLIAIISFNMFWDLISWIFDSHAGFEFLVKLSDTMFYVNGNMAAFTFCTYVEASLSLENNKMFKRIKIISVALSILGIVLVIANWFLGFYFVIKPGAVYERSNLFLLCYIMPVLILSLMAIVIDTQKITATEKLTYISYMIFPMLAIIIQSFFYGISLIYPAMLLAVMLIYNNIYLIRSKKIIEQEAIMTKQSTALMISQIQPHFLYNTLTTISNLCTTNPKEAEECTIMFSQYLRTNLDSLRHMEPVPFGAELDHVEIYLELEKKRFKDKLNVEYNIESTNFLVPALGIQPIVENSVKHGIRGKEEPGHLLIKACAVDGGHQLIIQDDGVGFDPSAPAQNDGRSHVGMQNVKERLQRMVNATMTIESSPGHGCKTTIFFPKQ